VKVLIYFADMLRADLLNFHKPGSHLETTLLELGGIFFSRAYTPSPDTPRSLSCFFSGLNPTGHGTDMRTKWPRFSSRTPHESLLASLSTAGFSVTALMPWQEIERGMLFPEDCWNGKVQIIDDPVLAELAVAEAERSVLFVTDNRYHDVVDLGASFRQSHSFGANLVAKGLKYWLDSQSWDLVLLFSDHGCKYSWERSSGLYLLDDNRTKITLFLHGKGDSGVKNDSELRSITDIFPTLAEALNFSAPDSLDGVSLRKGGLNRRIAIEDYLHVDSRYQIADGFRVISEDGSYYRTEMGAFVQRNGDSEISEAEVLSDLDDFLATNTTAFTDAKEIWAKGSAHFARARWKTYVEAIVSPAILKAIRKIMRRGPSVWTLLYAVHRAGKPELAGEVTMFPRRRQAG
jgi:hypothetical protein